MKTGLNLFLVFQGEYLPTEQLAIARQHLLEILNVVRQGMSYYTAFVLTSYSLNLL